MTKKLLKNAQSDCGDWSSLEHNSINPYTNGDEASRILKLAFGANEKVVKLLLQWRGPIGELVDPSPQDEPGMAIILASKRGFAEVVETLLNDDRVNPTEENFYALRGAIHYKRKDVVLLLLDWMEKNDKGVWLDNEEVDELKRLLPEYYILCRPDQRGFLRFTRSHRA